MTDGLPAIGSRVVAARSASENRTDAPSVLGGAYERTGQSLRACPTPKSRRSTGGVRRRGEGRLTGLRVFCIVVVAVAGMIALVVPASAAVAPDVSRPAPLLTARWWQQFSAISGRAFARCDVGEGDTVFLAGTTGGSAHRHCTISSRQSILVPLINTECSTAEGNGKTPAELTQCARQLADQFSALVLKIDGTSIPNLAGLRVVSRAFTLTAVDGNVFGIPPSTTLSVSDGYWALIGPLSPGHHTVEFGGIFAGGKFTTNATYSLTVTT